MNTTPIEFMAWDKRFKKMYDSANLHFLIDNNINIETAKVSSYEFEWLQRTALRSINDEPIYNHMIVKNENRNYFVVDMFDYTKMYYLSECNLEIVGNRFQHEELLELCK